MSRPTIRIAASITLTLSLSGAGYALADELGAPPVSTVTPSPSVAQVSGSNQPDPAGPAAARNLRRALEPLWSDLSEQQREILAPFESQWNTWASDEKKVWVLLANRFPGLAPQAKGKAMLRIREWAALSPADRLVARHNYQLARERNQGERGQEWQRYQQMTPEQQNVLRDNGTLSNTAARKVAPSGLAREAAQPLSIKRVSKQASDR